MSILGTRVTRVEDPALLTVGGRYVDDLAPADAVHAVFVRSEMAHAEIGGIDVSEARHAEGVVAVFTAADLELPADPPGMGMLNQQMLRTRLATDRVRYVGEPVAVVVATSLTAGIDAAGMVLVDYEPLPAVISPTESLADETLLFPDAGTNVAFAVPKATGDDFFDDCEVTVDLVFRNHRLAPCPLETRATVARWDNDDSGTLRLTQWSTTQGAHDTRNTLAAATRCRGRSRPRDLPRRGRRLRRQERWLPGGHRGGIDRTPSGAAGALGGNPNREHARARARPGVRLHGHDRRQS